jgi:hypothetical protein
MKTKNGQLCHLMMCTGANTATNCGVLQARALQWLRAPRTKLTLFDRFILVGRTVTAAIVTKIHATKAVHRKALERC